MQSPMSQLRQMAAQWAMNWWSDREGLAGCGPFGLGRYWNRWWVRGSGCRTRGGRGDLKWILTSSFGLSLDALKFGNDELIIYRSDKQADLAKNGTRDDRFIVKGLN
jgi:hypothetical protein